MTECEKQRTDTFPPVGKKGSKRGLDPALQSLMTNTADQQTCLPEQISPWRMGQVAASSNAQTTKQIYKERK